MSEGIHTSIPTGEAMGGGGAPEPTGDDKGTPSFLDQVPEAYRDKPYMKDIDSPDKLFQQFDNAQSLIGKKAVGVPTEDSSPEEWNEFYNKMGRPESHDKYEFEKTELPEGLARLEDTDAKAKELFHKAGLTAAQAKQVMKGYDEILSEQFTGLQSQQQEQLTKMNDEFESLLDQEFGGKKEEAVERVNKLMSENVSDSMKAHIDSLDNKSLMVLTSVLNNVHQKYVSEDGAPTGGDAPAAISVESMRADAKAMMMSPEYKDVMHPNHEAAKAKVSALYQKIATAPLKK